MEDTVFGILVLWFLILCGVGFVRIFLVYCYRVRALREVSAKADQATSAGEDWRFRVIWREHLEVVERCGYLKMAFEVWKWQYRSFFPNL